MLSYLLAGQPPFAGDNVYLVLQRTEQGAVDLSPLHAARAPHMLTAIYRHAPAGDPLKRYPSADALARDLERYLRQRRRLLLGLASLALLLVLLGSLKLFHWLTPPDVARSHGGAAGPRQRQDPRRDSTRLANCRGQRIGEGRGAQGTLASGAVPPLRLCGGPGLSALRAVRVPSPSAMPDLV